MLKRITEDIWSQESESGVGAMRLPARATIIRLPGDGVLVHSPLAIDDATAKELAAIGEVRFLVAPSRLHWMFLKAAKQRYPKARVFGAPGLETKLGGVPFEPLAPTGPLEGLSDSLLVERIEGAPSMTEHAFLHLPSRSLIVSDLLFNVHHCERFMTNLVLRIVGAHGKAAQSRAWRLVVKDRDAAARSVATLLGWDFERVIVGHGDVVSEGARDRARSALSWMAGTAAAAP